MLLTLIVLDLNILQKKFIENKSLKTNSFRIQAHEYFCFGFIDFMLAGQILTEFTNLLLLSNF